MSHDLYAVKVMTSIGYEIMLTRGCWFQTLDLNKPWRQIPADHLLFLVFILFSDYPSTNETGPLPLCTFSVMGLSMCSSIFSESSPLRSKSGIINELSGFPELCSNSAMQRDQLQLAWSGHTGHAYCIWFVGKH